jgi:hypothetical protein
VRNLTKLANLSLRLARMMISGYRLPTQPAHGIR